MRINVTENRFRWPVPILVLPLLAILLAGSGTLRGAAVTWSSPADILGDSDVVTAGSLAYAYAWSFRSATVNGVAFTAPGTFNGGSNVLATNFYYTDFNDFTSSSPPFSALSSAYSNILVGSLFANAGMPYTVPVTLANLTVGHTYQLQIWVNDPRGPENSRTENVSSPGGNTITLGFSSANLMNSGGPGQYTVGTFTADSTNQIFTMSGNGPAYVSQLNALQLRDTSIQQLPVWVAIKPAGVGAVNLIFKGPSGSNYTLLTTTNLSTPMTNWAQFPGGTGTFGAVNTTNLDPAATNQVRYYRIRSP